MIAKKFLKISLIGFLVLCLSNCTKQSQIPAFDPAFEPYIESYTSGMVASDVSISLRFTFAVDSSLFVQWKTDDLISSNPKVEGNLAWVDAHTLVFKPKRPLKEGKIYIFELRLDRFIHVPKSLSRFKWGVRVMEQGFQLSDWMLHAFDSQGVTKYYATGVVKSANPADIKALEKGLYLSVENNKCNLHWTADASARVFNFSSDTFGRLKAYNKVEILAREANIYIPKTLGTAVQFDNIAPGPLQWRMFFGEENFLWIAFSEPLDPNQNLHGLVLLDGIAPRRFMIRQNHLFCYFDRDFKGGNRVEIFPGIKDIRGGNASYHQEIRIEGIIPKPALKWLHSGNILPTYGSVNIPFAAVGLKAVDVKVMRVLEQNVPFFLQDNNLSNAYNLRKVGKVVARTTLNLQASGTADPTQWETYFVNITDLIKAEPGAIYRVTLSMKPQYSLYPCRNEDWSKFSDVDEEEYGDYRDDYGDYRDDYVDYYYPRGYEWSESDNPCHVSYYNSERWINTQFLVTNISLTAKTGADGKVWVWAADIRTGQPLSGVKVEVFDYQMLLLESGKTGKDGLVILPVKEDPFLVVASRGKEKSYLKMAQGTELSLSAFDVDGDPVQKGLKGFIYGERGVWRPGDTLHLWFMLENKYHQLPEDYPIILELKNPFRQTVAKKLSTRGIGGIHAFKLVTSPNAPTGKWIVQVKAGQAIFTKYISIEAIEPNRLKIHLNSSDILKVGKENNFHLEASWLHGAPASGLRAVVEMNLKEGTFSPDGFKGFQFFDESSSFTPEARVIFSGNLDTMGKVSFSYKPDLYHAPGVLKAILTTKVFEPGGAFSIDQVEIPMYPYERYAGFRVLAPLTDWGSYSGEKPLEVDLALVDKQGNPIREQSSLELSLYRLEWHWWLSQSNTRSAIVENELDDPEVKTFIKLTQGRARYTLPIQDLYGCFLLRVADSLTGHQSSRIIRIGYQWGEQASEARGMIFLKTLKKKVVAGDSASIIIPSISGAQILVSIEAGGKVLDYQWIQSTWIITEFKFTTTPDMAPGVYIYASVVQPWQIYNNDLPLRLYGVTYQEIEYPDAKLEPSINMASEVRAGHKATLSVSEKNGRPMAYTLAIVDEGLLDLTRFATPDPFKAFNAKESLVVKTWDLYSMIVGSFASRMDRIFMVGGDEYRSPHSNLQAQRFKPFVFAKGPFWLKKGETRKHTLDIPEYVGSARVMIVAAGEGAYGSAEKYVTITKPVMVLGSIPRVLGPGEEVKVAATVWRTKSSVKMPIVSLELKGDLKLMGSNEQKVVFNAGQKEKTVFFNIKTGKLSGICNLRFTARWQNETSVWNSDIDLRNPNPVITEVKDYLVKPGQIIRFTQPSIMGSEEKRVLEVSYFPGFNLNRRATELIQYPYGCSEQTVASLFPQLLLKSFVGLDAQEEEKRIQYIRAGIQKLTAMQRPEGGIAFWPGTQTIDQWVTSWVGHFMLEAQKQGFAIPTTFYDAWLNYQRRMAVQWRHQENSSAASVQAYRLFTLALAGKPEMGAMNRLQALSALPQEALLLLAQAYALTGNSEIALELLNRRGAPNGPLNDYDLSLGSVLRNQALQLYVKARLKFDEKENFVLAREIAKKLSGEGYLSTHEIAWAMLALQAYITQEKTHYKPEFVFGFEKKNLIIKPDSPVWYYSFKGGGGKFWLNNKSNGPLYVSLSRTYRPMPGEEMNARSQGLSLEVFYLTSDKKPLDPKHIKQSSDFLVQVKVSNHSGKPLKYGALNLILASGWQILNTRFMQNYDNGEEQNFSWQDIRDDRVYTYFYLGKDESKVFTFKLNASYNGRFFMPAILAEDMYNPSVRALVPGFYTEVVGY